MGSVAAGGLIETYSDVNEILDISDVLKKKNVFALQVNGDSMIDASTHRHACISLMHSQCACRHSTSRGRHFGTQSNGCLCI